MLADTSDLAQSDPMGVFQHAGTGKNIAKKLRKTCSNLKTDSKVQLEVRNAGPYY